MAGNSTALEQLEPSFNQDLNGDGFIGVHSTSKLISTDTNSFGSIDFTQVGNNYFLYAHGTTTGPELTFNGSPTVAGGAWAPIGAALTATGYEIAWKDSATNQFTVWNADTSGNQNANTIGVVAGNSTALEQLEPSFNQDLNGDGFIGVHGTPAATLQTSRALSGAAGAAGNDPVAAADPWSRAGAALGWLVSSDPSFGGSNDDLLPVVPSLDSLFQAPAAGGEAWSSLGGFGNADPATANAGQGLRLLSEASASPEQVPALSGFFAAPAPMADFSATPCPQAGIAPIIATDPLQHAV